ncbi:glycerol-3-phosphate dehydrogenase/oxidase [Rugamonas sp. CCM 8940]|uniref:glycerol-3-phosphate dehydrogenase/oxidase n=1 Tax=Rugamonas sp. CCM 8940 TaxID=2765359 RepID=UPI0018F731A7|nr:glycerol-3-phosphate dehydrogenase/oxidase [Rugamonas sp. CCM 8940]MBJ7313832.1 glycerol-3-phosphate dehydrogenase/oxidase [Rugamonas sp. CCM 8940]
MSPRLNGGGAADGGRDELPALLAREWDLLIIGGGITGAGILLEAARRGLKALLVEQRDFAWGTSSRSSKLVHGGLRYLKEGKFGLTRESVREREHLLREAAGLVEPQSFAFGDYRGRKPGRRMFQLGLAIYDLMAGQRARHHYPRDEFLALAPNVASAELEGGMCYTDAKTDDARLVLRVLHEAQRHGGVAVNYLAVEQLLRAGDDAAQDAKHGAKAGQGAKPVQGATAGQNGTVCGARLRDGITEATHQVRARLVVSATGAWADGLRAQGGAAPRLRPLRGSHLVLPAWRLPLAQAVSLMHPADGRPVFAFPWEGVTLVGTTDVDHRANMAHEAAITRAEVDYLMAALHDQFPQLALVERDIIATYAGVRPVIDSGQSDPSKEGREHALWLENGLLTVTGGKLTTFRVIALDALKKAAPLLPGWNAELQPQPVFVQPPPLRYNRHLSVSQAARLRGRYGPQAQALVDAAHDGELETIGGSETIWAQLRWAARGEAVQKLEDLLLRRTRLGLQLRGGGVEVMARVRAICQAELGWSDVRWSAEQNAYLALWNSHYSVPVA